VEKHEKEPKKKLTIGRNDASGVVWTRCHRCDVEFTVTFTIDVCVTCYHIEINFPPPKYAQKIFFHHQKIDLRSQFKPTKKPRPGGLALAFKTLGQAKAVIKPSTYGPAWPGLFGPVTNLYLAL
jgi:hypothetical protein